MAELFYDAVYYIVVAVICIVYAVYNNYLQYNFGYFQCDDNKCQSNFTLYRSSSGLDLSTTAVSDRNKLDGGFKASDATVHAASDISRYDLLSVFENSFVYADASDEEKVEEIIAAKNNGESLSALHNFNIHGVWGPVIYECDSDVIKYLQCNNIKLRKTEKCMFYQRAMNKKAVSSIIILALFALVLVYNIMRLAAVWAYCNILTPLILPNAHHVKNGPRLLNGKETVHAVKNFGDNVDLCFQRIGDTVEIYVPQLNGMLQTYSDMNNVYTDYWLVCGSSDMSVNDANYQHMLSQIKESQRVNVISFDYPGHGGSQGEATMHNIMTATEYMYNKLVNMKINAQNIHIFGERFGCGPALELAVNNANITSVILNGPNTCWLPQHLTRFEKFIGLAAGLFLKKKYFDNQELMKYVDNVLDQSIDNKPQQFEKLFPACVSR